MKKILAFTFLALLVISFKPDVKEDIRSIDTVVKAKEYVKKNREAMVIWIDELKGTTEWEKSMLNSKQGDLTEKNGYLFKVLDSRTVNFLRASYIFFDGARMESKEINDKRKLIIKKYNEGKSFADMSKEYTMDGNPYGGDLNWFEEGSMVEEFEKAVKDHKRGDVFTIDVPSKKWYYVTLKTYDETMARQVAVLQVKSDVK